MPRLSITTFVNNLKAGVKPAFGGGSVGIFRCPRKADPEENQATETGTSVEVRMAWL